MSKIAKLKVDKAEFDRQAAALTNTNVVFNEVAEYDEALVASWVPDPATPVVPQLI